MFRANQDNELLKTFKDLLNFGLGYKSLQLEINKEAYRAGKIKSSGRLKFIPIFYSEMTDNEKDNELLEAFKDLISWKVNIGQSLKIKVNIEMVEYGETDTRNFERQKKRMQANEPKQSKKINKDFETHTPEAKEIEFAPPSLDAVLSYAKYNSIDLDGARAFYNASEKRNWCDASGLAIRNWQAALKSYVKKYLENHSPKNKNDLSDLVGWQDMPRHEMEKIMIEKGFTHEDFHIWYEDSMNNDFRDKNGVAIKDPIAACRSYSKRAYLEYT